eukprot:jgi/Tetstr1/459396/TSEL_004775.t1
MLARRRGKPQPALAALVSTLLALLHNSSASRASFYGLLLSGAVVASAARPGGVTDFPDYEQPRALSSVDSSKELSAVEESVSRQLWGEYNVTVSLLSGGGTDDQAVRVSAIELETSNVYRAELTAANLSALGVTFRTLGQVHDFLGESLSFTLPQAPAVDASSPGSLTSNLWKSEVTGNLAFAAKLEPEYAFFQPIGFTLQLELVKEGSSEERNSYLVKKLTQQFQRTNAENTLRFERLNEENTLRWERVNTENTLRFEAQIGALSQTVNLLATQLNGRIFIKGVSIPINVETVVIGNVQHPSLTVISSGTTGLESLVSQTGTAVQQKFDQDSYWGRSGSNYYYAPSLKTALEPIFGSVTAKLDAVVDAVNVLSSSAAGILPADTTSDELMPLTICTNITYLDLSHAELTHLDFLPSLPKLETLILNGATAISDLSALRTLTRLQTLDLTGCSGISDVGLLNQLPALRKVTLTGTSVINSQTLIDPQLRIVGP